MSNGFQLNRTSNQIEHKKLTSIVKMTNVLQSNGTSYAYYIPTSYLPLTILQPTYLLTYPPTHPPTYYLGIYLDVLPTYLLTYLSTTYNLPKCITYLPIHPLLTYLHINYLPTYPTAHPPTWMYYLPTFPHTYFHTCTTYLPTYLPTYYLPTHPPISYNLPTFIPHNLVMMCQNKHVK